MKKAVFWAIIAVMLTIPIFAFEFYLSFIGLGDPIIYDVDHAYGYAPRANQKKERRRGAVVTINESGLRSIESWKNRNESKVVFIGDSVTWGGSSIDDTATFPHLFCDIINKKIQKEKYVCGNAGVSAYGVLNISLRAKYDERIHDADVFIFVIYIGDFIRGLAGPRNIHFFLRENDVFLPAINELINYIGFKYEINRFLGKTPDIEAKHSFEAVEFAINTLKNICDELEKADKDYYIVLSPSGHDLNFQQDYHASVLSMVSSLLPDVILLSKPLASEENTFRDDSIHYTIAGHAAVAKYLSQTIPLGLTP